MYLRAAHVEKSIPALKSFVQQNSLGILITSTPGLEQPELQASHIPWVYSVNNDNDDDLGTLRGHMARANPQSKSFIQDGKNSGTPTVQGYTLPKEVMVLFNGPADHYVTPKFYTATKPATGKVVPTWNYSAVQAYGKATVYFEADSPVTDAYLSSQVAELSEQSEHDIMGYGRENTMSTWKVTDAPSEYINMMKKAIIGIEVRVTSLGGKHKMSQEMKEEDREGVVKGFLRLGSETGKKVAETVEERGRMKSVTA